MSNGKKRVLVVDDDDDLRAVISSIVRRRGHEVLTATNGSEALALVGEAPAIDLLILDVAMPVLDGLETLKRLRAGGRRELPVVLLTAQRSGADVVEGYAAGGDYYLTKPFEAESLLRIVDYLVGDLSPEERRKIELAL